MKTRTHKSNYFYGNKISKYGIENGYVDYATLSKAFDAVIVNDITKLFYANINGDYNEPEQINGYIDNYAEIEELNDTISELMLDNDNGEQDEKINELQAQIDDLEREQDEQQEIYQYFIVSENGADILQEYTDDPVFYIPVIDCYVWGVTHWGTSWDYVLTNIKIDLSEE